MGVFLYRVSVRFPVGFPWEFQRVAFRKGTESSKVDRIPPPFGGMRGRFDLFGEAEKVESGDLRPLFTLFL